MGRRRKQKTRTGRKQGARCAVEKDAVHIVDVGLTMESEATSGSDTLATMMKQVKLQCVERGKAELQKLLDEDEDVEELLEM